MAVTFPYATTVHGLSATVQHLRNVFPPQVTAETLKKLGIAPGNESSILQTIRFIGLVNEEGDKNAEAAKAFVIHEDEDFAPAFGALVRKAYSAVFEHLGDNAWDVGKDKLITFFRQSDQTSARVGEQQALTFLALAGFAGHGAPQGAPGNGGRRQSAPATRRTRGERAAAKGSVLAQPAGAANGSPLAVSVRIELNLPVTDNQEVYDKMFRSIRENLING